MKDKLRNLRARKAELLSQADALVENIDQSKGLSADDQKKFDALTAEAASIEADAKRIEAVIERKRDAETATPATPAKTDAAKFESFADQVLAVVRAHPRFGGKVDPRLMRAATGMNEETGSDGGFLVEHDFIPDLIKPMWDAGGVLSRVRRYQVSGNSNGACIPAVDETSRATGSRMGGMQVYRKKEGTAANATKPKFRNIKLDLLKLIGMTYITDELMQDVGLLGQFLTDAFREEMTVQIEGEIINGSGAGEMLGILKSGATVTQTKVAAQAATTFVTGNVLSMYSRLPPRSKGPATWIINSDVFPQIPQMTIGNYPVFVAPGGLQNNPNPVLFGKPVVESEWCKTLGTIGDVILADLSQYLVIEKGGVKQSVSMDFAFDDDEPVFKFTVRNNGQPLWSTPVTPINSAISVSPFIILETRS